MTVIRREGGSWRMSAPEPVGEATSLLDRLRARAEGLPVAFGIDCPLGLPREYARLHTTEADFPAFLRGLAARPGFLDVADSISNVSAMRPFYPTRGVAGMTRAAHAEALGLEGAGALCRACDRATAARPAGAPVFWTLGANQSGKAAIAAWSEVIAPALLGALPVRLWPFEGNFCALLRPGWVAVAETYPAEALRQLDVVLAGSKRRQADRAACAPALRAAMARLGVVADTACNDTIAGGFGADGAGEDRIDCVLGALCVLSVVVGRRTDKAPDDVWIRTWEGWVLGQTLFPK